MRSRAILLIIFGPAFACWWGGFLLLHAGVEIPSAIFAVWAGAVTLAVSWLGISAVARTSAGRRFQRALAVVAFLVAWVLPTLGGGFLFALMFRESGPVPWAALPLLYASLASVVLGLRGVATDGPAGPRLVAWALGGLLGVEVLLALFTVAGVLL